MRCASSNAVSELIMVDEIAHSNIYSDTPQSNPIGGRGSTAASRSPRPADGVPLVEYTKSYSADVNDTQKARSSRSRRFALKSVVNDIFPDSRTSKCHRIRAPQKQVEVWRGVSAGIAGKAFYKGLYTCGKLWTCPVCAAKISERRRPEIKKAIDEAKRQGLKVLFVTQTIKHGLDMPLSQSLTAFAAADKLLWSSRSGASMRDQFGIEGTIKITETTWGEDNGWHPHKHILMFVSGDSSLSEIEATLSYRWILACVKQGLPAPGLGRAIKVFDGSHADAYMSKWGLEDEMTKSHSKVAKNGGFTPFALLENILQTGDAQSWELFKEYASAFKGKRQLVWSKGLRARLLPDVVELSDEELAGSEDLDAQAVFWASLSVQEWKAVRFFKYESILLDKSEDSLSPDVLQKWLDGVTDAYRYARANDSVRELNSE